MARYFKGPRLTQEETAGRTLRPISFALKHSNSDAFKTLFAEGMSLVETTAAYLDGRGRAESKALRRPIALAYATESMRMTTRLMQIASWLLLRRAVNEGELTLAQAMSERHRVRLQRQDMVSPPEVIAELPPVFVDFCIRSIRLQERVLHLDRSIAVSRDCEPMLAPQPVAMQLAQLQAAFAPREGGRSG
jgi:regulator of CtrA degradation